MLAPDWSALQLTAEQWTSRTLTVWCEFRLLRIITDGLLVTCLQWSNLITLVLASHC